MFRQFATLVTFVLVLPAAVWGQGYPASVPPPPIPTGPVLTDLPAPHSRPTWLEDGADIRPAGGTDEPKWAGETWPPTPMNTHGSACTFDCANPIFQPGVTSTQVLFGAYYSSSLGPTIRAFDYTLLTIRHGWMLTGPTEFFYLPGNWEFLCDVSGGLMTSDYGNWLAGSSLYLRYNILKPDSCIVPYAQIGVGFLCQDAYRDIDDQRAVGQMFEFHLHYEIGLKYFVARNLSLDLEAGFQHLSNANWTDRNYGVNAFGAQVGFTYYFPWGQQ